jgi:hypothetical protein
MEEEKSFYKNIVRIIPNGQEKKLQRLVTHWKKEEIATRVNKVF